MALQNLTLLTIVFEFVPPLIVTLVYLLFFGKRKSKFIEAFIILMYLKTVTVFIIYIALALPDVPVGFDQVVDTRLLSWLLLTDMIFQFFTTLQEYLIWVMVSFFAVLFGMIVIAAKLALQEPMKKRFKNIITRITRRELEIDEYAGFKDRITNVTFEGVEPQPLNPEVQKHAWKEAWKDYLSIGLATVVPSISVYIGSLPEFISGTERDFYFVNILIFLTWIYRFGYPASNRIAKGAGLCLGNRDIGGEMMRGVLGWFFRLNIIITLGVIGVQAYQAFTSGTVNIVDVLITYYTLGLISAIPPIIFAILMLPLVENFAIILYKKTFDVIYQTKSRISGYNFRTAIKNLVSSIGTGLVVAGVFAGAIFVTTLNYAVEHGLFLIFPQNIDNEYIQNALTDPANNGEMIGEVIWLLLILAIPFVMMIVLGIFSRFVRERIKGGAESFALFSGVTLSVATYYLFPSLDYIIEFRSTPAEYAGELFFRLRPVLTLPAEEMWLARFAFQFIVNLPIIVFSTLFILYFFEYRESWRISIGETSGPLLNIRKHDLVQAFVMFFGGLLVAVLGVWAISFIVANPSLVNDLLQGLLIKIGKPDGLEGVLPPPVDFLVPRWIDPNADPFGWFAVFTEHNVVRTLLMLVIGPIFWSAVLWYWGVQKTESEQRIGSWSIIALVAGGILTYVWTIYDSFTLYNPSDPIWGFAAQLGLRAIVVFGVMFLLFGLIVLVKNSSGRGFGAWWFPLFITMFAIEYFVYDDQFTLIALTVLPFIITVGYKMIGRNRDEDFKITYIKFSLMSVTIAEVLSTALTIGGIAIIEFSWGLDVWSFLASIIPHAVIEIPTFLIAAGASIRIAKDLWPTIESQDWVSVPSKTRALLGDQRTWRTYLLIVFFLVLAALIEAFATPIIYWMVYSP
ncbi:MAG: stage II sporulation protein M [Candidatus Thorarchaeota archaeon]